MARPLIPMTGGIPMPTASDSGKVLTVGETGKYGLAAVPSELPASAAIDEGKVLTVDSSGDPAWANVPAELPASAAIDSGKVLTVNSSGNPAWSAPSGGGGAFCIALNITAMTADKTFSQILAAYTDKQVIMLISTGEHGDLVYYMSHTTTDRNGDLDSISFCRVGNVSTTISVNTENTWSVI